MPILKDLPNLAILNVGNNKIKTFKNRLEPVAHSLIEFDISFNSIQLNSRDDPKDIINELRLCQKLQKLNLKGNQIMADFGTIRVP